MAPFTSDWVLDSFRLLGDSVNAEIRDLLGEGVANTGGLLRRARKRDS